MEAQASTDRRRRGSARYRTCSGTCRRCSQHLGARYVSINRGSGVTPEVTIWLTPADGKSSLGRTSRPCLNQVRVKQTVPRHDTRKLQARDISSIGELRAARSGTRRSLRAQLVQLIRPLGQSDEKTTVAKRCTSAQSITPYFFPYNISRGSSEGRYLCLWPTLNLTLPAHIEIAGVQ